jgi:UDP-N-acetylmuramate dehydrogenase
MAIAAALYEQLAAIPNVSALRDAGLAAYTRFGIGGPASVLVDTSDPDGFREALRVVSLSDVPQIVIGGGTNLIVSDAGFDGIVLRYTGAHIWREGDVLEVQSGAVLQDVVDRSIDEGLNGLQTMTGIPGYLGGAVYGNAGAYGRSIQELVEAVAFTDGCSVRSFTNQDCQFTYRESIFKRNKQWVILSARLRFQPGDASQLGATASEIRTVRDKKYPPTMKCAGSIFKNLLYAQLPPKAQAEIPPKLVREGKVPSGWFLEQVGVMGLRVGDIQVATYHGNLIYNDGAGTAADLLTVVNELKRRVRERFGFDLQEEVQYVGFKGTPRLTAGGSESGR